MHSIATRLSGPAWARRQRRPLSATVCGPSATEVQEAIVLVWLLAFDGPQRPANEARLRRWVMRELQLGPGTAKARIRGARELAGPSTAFALLRGELDATQRERVLSGARHLASIGAGDGTFDRISAPVLSSWLGLDSPAAMPRRTRPIRSLQRLAQAAIAFD